MELPPNVEVELDIFSGRRNPSWPMPTGQIEQLLNAVRQTQITGPSEPPGLGYRGFIIRGAMKRDRLPTRVLVYGGTIAVGTNHHQLYYADVTGLERQLLDAAVRLGYGDVIRAFAGPRVFGDAAAAS